MWHCMPVITVPGKGRQEDQEFRFVLELTVSLRLARITGDHVNKNSINNNNNKKHISHLLAKVRSHSWSSRQELRFLSCVSGQSADGVEGRRAWLEDRGPIPPGVLIWRRVCTPQG